MLKHNLGYAASGMEISLKAFDRFLKSKGIDKICISESLAQEWCAKRKGEANDTWSHRINFLRQFCIYLHNLGFDAYIPQKLPTKKDDIFIPYIYSDEEMFAIFNAADSLRLYDSHMNGLLFIMPTLIRLLFATGLRIGEALALKTEDVNIESNFLIVRKSKNGKERIVPFTNSLSKVFTQYISYKKKLPCIKENYFFIKPNGENCCNSGVDVWWVKILSIAKVPRRGNEVGPRIQDIRHSFCVKSMKKMTEEGKDLYYTLPILSTYIGHTKLASTDRYVRMTADMYPNLLGKIDSICSYIFPELKCR
jgi:site-specific recombinase XerD